MAEMKYVQMTINDWLELKGQLEAELRGAAAGFVRIGFLLRKIEETKGYENDGSKSLAEWARDNYGLSATAVSRFMAINRKYSIDGYSERLKPEYIQYGSAKLSEMLALPDSDLEMVSPEMKREDIREIKKFNREAGAIAPAQKEPPAIEEFDEKADSAIAENTVPEAADEPARQTSQAEELPNVLPEHKWVIEFFRENKEIMNDLYSSKAYEEGNTEGMKEIVNPAGARTFRHKMTMVSMMESRIMVKVSVKSPAPMSWAGFFQIAAEAFEGKIDGKNTYKNVFGEEENPKTAAEKPKTVKTASEPKKAEPAAGGQKAEQDEQITKENEQIPERNEQTPQETNKKSPELSKEEIAPAQKEPPAIDNSNEKSDSAIAENTLPEEPEQVEVDEILPAPIEPDPMRDLKDRFTAEMNSLKIMLDCDNFTGMAQTIERLEHLRIKMVGLAATAE